MTVRERNLAIAFGLVIFLLLNLIALPKLKQWGDRLSRSARELDGELLATQSWIGQEGFWLARQQWLAEHQPVFSDEISPATLVEQLRAFCEKHQVTIEQQNLTEFPLTGFHTTAANLRLSGSLDNMIRWLYAIQQPEHFIICSQFRCESTDPSSSQMRWSATLAKVYRLPNSTP
jgi:hypothetical protein